MSSDSTNPPGQPPANPANPEHPHNPGLVAGHAEYIKGAAEVRPVLSSTPFAYRHITTRAHTCMGEQTKQ